MEDIKDIIGTIVRGCAQGGVVVSEVLAAFVARTVRMKLFLFFVTIVLIDCGIKYNNLCFR
jgi:hypothetical protein